MPLHTDDVFCHTITTTGSKIYINTNHESFYVIPDANFAELEKLTSLFTDIRLGNSHRLAFTLNQIEVITNLLRSTTRGDFITSFNNLFTELYRLKNCRSGSLSKQRSYFMKLLFRLWAEGVILFPAGIISQKKNCLDNVYHMINWTNNELSSGPVFEIMQSVDKGNYYDSPNTNDRAKRRLRELLMCIGPIKEKSHISPEMIDTIISIAPTNSRQDMKYLYRGLHHLTGVDRYVELHDSLSVDFMSTLVKRTEAQKITRTKRFDFMWVIEKDNTLEAWRKELSEWLESLINLKSVTSIVISLNKILDYLIDNPGITRDPVEYIASSYKDGNNLTSYVCKDLTTQQSHQQYLSSIHDFFEHLLDKYATTDDGDEGSYRLPGFVNPISSDDIPTQNVRAGRTHRVPMPRFLVKKAMEIITEGDFGWCKQFDEDYFKWSNPDTGKEEKIWSPVRAMAILLKMLLPLRTYQVRMLDSGEGDPERFDHHVSKWVPNKSKNANHWKSGAGFLRKMYDGEQCKYITGFYINTNKTQDRQTMFLETGYEIPWENHEVINLASSLRDFQEKYNQVSRPTAYTELIHEGNMPTADVAERIPHRFYLFRDPCKAIKALPVTDGRLQGFWRKLLKELEKRLQKEGHGDVVLLENDRACAFDLHSLRVTGLTMLAEKGVPIEILSAMVAGHATVLMTLYYTKFHAGHVTDILSEAQLKADENARAEFEDFLKNNPLATLKKAVAFNSEDSLQFTAKSESAVWRFLDYGICPVGCTKCDQGGSPIIDHADRKVYGPVPGGTMNCACCRFFLSGPPFLGPLVAKYNEMVNVLDVCASEMRKNQADLQRINRAKFDAEQDGTAFTNLKALRLAEGNVEEAMERLDVCGMTCHHLYNLIHQSLAIQKTSYGKSDKNLPLIYQCNAEELEAHLVEATKYDLYDEICQSGEYYKSINTSMAKLQRRNLFYKMLVRNGKGAMLLSLDDENIDKAINVSNRLMYKRLGRKTTNNLINGKIPLDSIDGKFTQALELAISEEIGRPLKLNDSLIGFENKQILHYSEGACNG